MPLDFRPLGDGAVRVGIADRDDPRNGPRTERLLLGLGRCLEEFPIPGVIEWVPGYVAMTVFYRPEKICYAPLCEELKRRSRQASEVTLPPSRLIMLPVCYGGVHGPDLEFVASHHELSHAQAIEWHCKPEYRVRMMGFAPGFAYLSGLPEQLVTPRLAEPRLKVAAGSVGIGGEHTGVYPLETPGGWRIIGHMPVPLFDASTANPFLLSHGDRVRFRSVDQAEHDRITAAIVRGEYKSDQLIREDADADRMAD